MPREDYFVNSTGINTRVLSEDSYDNDYGVFSTRHPTKPYINRLMVMREERLHWHQRNIEQDTSTRSFLDSNCQTAPSSLSRLTGSLSSPRCPALLIKIPAGSLRRIIGNSSKGTIYRPPRLAPLAGISLKVEDSPNSHRSAEPDAEAMERTSVKQPSSHPLTQTTLEEVVINTLNTKIGAATERGEISGFAGKTGLSLGRPRKHLKPLLPNQAENLEVIERMDSHISLFPKLKYTTTAEISNRSHYPSPRGKINGHVTHNKRPLPSKKFMEVENSFIKISEGLSGSKSPLSLQPPSFKNVKPAPRIYFNPQNSFPPVAPNTPVCETEASFYFS